MAILGRTLAASATLAAISAASYAAFALASAFVWALASAGSGPLAARADGTMQIATVTANDRMVLILIANPREIEVGRDFIRTTQPFVIEEAVFDGANLRISVLAIGVF
jgi:hypothetical protein